MLEDCYKKIKIKKNSRNPNKIGKVLAACLVSISWTHSLSLCLSQLKKKKKEKKIVRGS